MVERQVGDVPRMPFGAEVRIDEPEERRPRAGLPRLFQPRDVDSNELVRRREVVQLAALPAPDRMIAAVGRAMEVTEDLDEIVAALEAEARRDIQTGSEAELDLDRLEVLSSVRMNAMGIVGYWGRQRERAADQES